MSRNDLAKLFKGVGAEIGVEQGVYSEVICQYATKLYAIDAWQSYDDYRDHKRQSKLDRFFRRTVNRLAPYNVEIIRKFSRDAVKDFKDESLDFVYIDANHGYAYVYEDIHEWTKKVKKGGIVAGHDYVPNSDRPQYEVARAVNDYCAMHRKKIKLYKDDISPSWMFYK